MRNQAAHDAVGYLGTQSPRDDIRPRSEVEKRDAARPGFWKGFRNLVSPQKTLTWLVGTRAIAAAPGYFVAAATMDKLGRKAIQALGFVVMGAAFAAMALIPNIEHLLVPFLIIYGISYFFTEFGPNATTFVYPSELFGVTSRTTGHGIAAATGKVGAFAGVFLFPSLMHWHGLLSAELTAAAVSLAAPSPCFRKPKARAWKN